jgi:hypothetical protein
VCSGSRFLPPLDRRPKSTCHGKPMRTALVFLSFLAVGGRATAQSAARQNGETLAHALQYAAKRDWFIRVATMTASRQGYVRSVDSVSLVLDTTIVLAGIQRVERLGNTDSGVTTGGVLGAAGGVTVARLLFAHRRPDIQGCRMCSTSYTVTGVVAGAVLGAIVGKIVAPGRERWIPVWP